MVLKVNLWLFVLDFPLFYLLVSQYFVPVDKTRSVEKNLRTVRIHRMAAFVKTTLRYNEKGRYNEKKGFSLLFHLTSLVFHDSLDRTVQHCMERAVRISLVIFACHLFWMQNVSNID